jgi:hypothetical protein
MNMNKQNGKLAAGLSLAFGLIVAGGFLLDAQFVPQSQPVYAPPQTGQLGFQIPGKAKMTITTTPANGSGALADVTGACYPQNYGAFYWNPFTRDLVGCLPNPGLVSGNSLANAMNYVAIIRGGGLTGGFGPSTLTGATIAPVYRDSFFNGSTALATITPPTGITDGAVITIVFTGTAGGLTWTSGGNISVAGTSTTAQSAVDFVWSVANSKWYPTRLA